MSDLTKLNWNQVYELPAVEFLSYIDFYNYQQKKKEQQIKAFQASTKHK